MKWIAIIASLIAIIMEADRIYTATLPQHYAAQMPVLKPEDFFNGHLNSWGVVEDFAGRAVQRFRMDAEASWQGDNGRQHELLHFADGTEKERLWTFHKIDAHHFTGTAPDVIGEALGENDGNALHWVYTIRISQNGSEQTVLFDDWLYLIDETHMFSLVSIRKWGLPVGRMTMFFSKDSL